MAETMSVTGSSLGGAEVVVTRIDDFDVEITGELPTLVVTHTDRPGVIAGVTAVLAEGGANIATMSDSPRAARPARAHARADGRRRARIEVAAPCVEAVPNVAEVRAVPAV